MQLTRKQIIDYSQQNKEKISNIYSANEQNLAEKYWKCERDSSDLNFHDLSEESFSFMIYLTRD